MPLAQRAQPRAIRGPARKRSARQLEAAQGSSIKMLGGVGGRGRRSGRAGAPRQRRAACSRAHRRSLRSWRVRSVRKRDLEYKEHIERVIAHVEALQKRHQAAQHANQLRIRDSLQAMLKGL